MPSTVIRRFDYSPEREELVVEFVTGRRYLYSAVPGDEVERLRRAFAKPVLSGCRRQAAEGGSHFNRHIRDRYSCRELV